MAIPMDPEEVFDELTKVVGSFCKEVTGRKVVLAGEEEIPKVEGEFILVDLTSADQVDWQSDDGVDEEGNPITVHNYQVVFTLTSFRGKAVSSLSRVLRSFNLPYLYEKYFPTRSAYAYASSSTISRLRVPLNVQKFENRAVVLVTFNVCFVETDTGVFEEIDKLNVEMTYFYPDPE